MSFNLESYIKQEIDRIVDDVLMNTVIDIEKEVRDKVRERCELMAANIALSIIKTGSEDGKVVVELRLPAKDVAPEISPPVPAEIVPGDGDGDA